MGAFGERQVVPPVRLIVPAEVVPQEGVLLATGVQTVGPVESRVRATPVRAVLRVSSLLEGSTYATPRVRQEGAGVKCALVAVRAPAVTVW